MCVCVCMLVCLRYCKEFHANAQKDMHRTIRLELNQTDLQNESKKQTNSQPRKRKDCFSDVTFKVLILEHKKNSV